MSSLKITLLKEKEVGKANLRGIRRLKGDKNITIDQMDSALMSLRLLATRVPSRVGELSEFLNKYAENIEIVNKELYEAVNATIEEINSSAE